METNFTIFTTMEKQGYIQLPNWNAMNMLVLVCISFCILTVNIIRLGTWKGWCNALRNQIYADMKKDIQQIRNHDLDMLHANNEWTDYDMPTCLGCYKRYARNKARKDPTNANLLFIIDSTFIIKRKHVTRKGTVVAAVIYWEVVKAKLTMDTKGPTNIIVIHCMATQKTFCNLCQFFFQNCYSALINTFM